MAEIIVLDWKKAIGIAGLILFGLAAGAFAQEGNFPATSAPSPVGSGARAMGQAGAFIATADDATAASWNPAALVILEKPEVSVVGSYEGQARLFDNPMIGDQSFTYPAFNYLSASYPFSLWERNFVVSVNYQRLYDFNYHFKLDQTNLDPDEEKPGEYDFSMHPCGCRDDRGDLVPCDDPKVATYIPCDPHNTPMDLTDDYIQGAVTGQSKAHTRSLSREVTQSGDIGALAPAVAFQITPKFALGFTYNFWMDGAVNQGYTQKTEIDRVRYSQNNSFMFQDMNLNLKYDPGVDVAFGATSVGDWIKTHSDYDESFTFRGQNFNAGLLLDLTARNTLGLVYRSGFTADVDGEWKFQQAEWEVASDNFFGTYDPDKGLGEKEREIKMRFPESYGLGFANRFSDAFSMELDATYVRWDQFTMEGTERNKEDNKVTRLEKTSLVSGLKTSVSEVDPVTTVRLGAEYIFIREKFAVPVRAGAFYDPQPAEESAQDYWGGTLGLGFAYKGLIVDAAYIYRFADDVQLIYTTNPEADKLLVLERGDIQQHSVLLSAIVHF